MNIYEEQVRKFYSEIWNRKNLRVIPQILHEDFEFRGSLGSASRGHEGFINYLQSIHSSLSGYQCIIEDIVIQPEKVFAKMTFTGVHIAEFMSYAATNKQISWAGAALFTFSGEKIASLWVLGDLKGLESQLN